MTLLTFFNCILKRDRCCAQSNVTGLLTGLIPEARQGLYLKYGQQFEPSREKKASLGPLIHTRSSVMLYPAEATRLEMKKTNLISSLPAYQQVFNDRKVVFMCNNCWHKQPEVGRFEQRRLHTTMKRTPFCRGSIDQHHAPDADNLLPDVSGGTVLSDSSPETEKVVDNYNFDGNADDDLLLKKLAELESRMAQDRRALHFLAKRVVSSDKQKADANERKPAAVESITPSSPSTAGIAENNQKRTTNSSFNDDAVTPKRLEEMKQHVQKLLRHTAQLASMVATARGELQCALDIAHTPSLEASLSHSAESKGGRGGIGKVHPVSPVQWRKVHQMIEAAEAELAALKRHEYLQQPGKKDPLQRSAKSIDRIARFLYIDGHGEPRSVWCRVLVTNIQYLPLSVVRLHCATIGHVCMAMIHHLRKPNGGIERAAVITFRSSFDAQRAVDMLDRSRISGIRVRMSPYFDSPDPTILAVAEKPLMAENSHSETAVQKQLDSSQAVPPECDEESFSFGSPG